MTDPLLTIEDAAREFRVSTKRSVAASQRGEIRVRSGVRATGAPNG